MICETCEFCRYWHDADPAEPKKTADDLGWCRRHAPRPLIVIGTEQACEEVVWPLVKRNDWCGEYEAESDPETISE